VRAQFILAILVAGLAFFAGSTGGALAGPAPTPVVIQLKWLHQFQFAGYYVALERGFFRDEGLDVELREGPSGADTTDTVLDGRADFTITSPGVLIERLRGKPVVAVAAIFQHSPAILLALANSGIDSPQALSGKRVMMGSGFSDAEPLATLLAEGVHRSPPVLVSHTGDLSALINGRVDAMTAYSTNEPFVLQQAGVAAAQIRPRQYGVDFYGDILVTSERLARARPETVEAVLRATRRGWAEAMARSDAAIKLILARYGGRKSREDLRFEAQAMQELILADVIEIGHMNPGRWEHIAQTYERVGLIEPGWSLDGFLFSQIREEQRRRFDRWSAWAGRAALGALGIALLLAGFVARLRRAVRARTRDLEASEQQFRTLFDSISEAIAILDPESGEIRVANRRTAELFALPAGQVEGRRFADLLRDLTPAGAPDLDLGSASGGPPLEWRTERPDGTAAWIEIGLKPAVIGGAERIVVVARDVTARKEADETLRQTVDALVASNTDLERFAYVSSHDLQTPLRNVVSYAQLLERRYRGRLDSDADDFIGFIVDNTRHMSALINDLLDYARVGGQWRSLVAVPAAGAVAVALETLRRDIEQAGAEVEVGTLPVVLAEETHLVSLFCNLLGNAVKYRDPDRQLSISVTAHAAEQGMWRFEVSDTGIGIDPEYHAKIFEIFQRLDPRRDPQGTGIGLALCQRVVNRFGGEIGVRSTPGVGSTFIFTLRGAES